MNLPPFFFKTLLLAGAVAGFAFVGCGEEADTSDTSEEKSNAEGDDDDDDKDAGSDEKDARADEDEDEDDEEAAAKAECEEDDRESCDECDNPPCGRLCIDEEWTDCESIGDTIEGLRDSGLIPGLPDGSVTVSDGGVMVTLGDSSVSIPTMDCPDSLECASEGMSFAGMAIGAALGGASFCVDPADPIGLPPTCSAPEDCQELGFTQSTCMEIPVAGKACIQLCQ